MYDFDRWHDRITRERRRQEPSPPECEHVWGIDGAHSNEYCKKCFIDRPKPTAEPPLIRCYTCGEICDAGQERCVCGAVPWERGLKEVE